MQQREHYVIGDVHGEYEMLLALVDKLPANAKLIFVGDLVNRGTQSREVVEFARNHAYAVVKGNHEGYFLEHGRIVLEALEKSSDSNLCNLRNYIGGVQMLWSYKLLKRNKEDPCSIIRNHEGIATLKNHFEWIKTLPLAFELGKMPNYSLPIVVSHGSIGDYWHFKQSHPDIFEMQILSNRVPPSKQSPIFNIYGHEVVPSVLKGKNFVCLDTGCGKSHDAKLSAYCVESGEVTEVCKSDLM